MSTSVRDRHKARTAVLSRLRIHTGPWILTTVLTAVALSVTAAAGPAMETMADRAVQRLVDAAPYPARDLVLAQPTGRSPIISVDPTRPLPGTPPAPDVTPDTLRSRVEARLAPVLAEAVEVTWSYRRTGISVGFDGSAPVGAALTGPGVTTEPESLAPLVSFHHHKGIEDDVRVVAGRLPTTDPNGDYVEVMVAAEVAERLGLVVGGEYTLHPGVSRVFTHDLGIHHLAKFSQRQPVPPTHVVTVAGVFVPVDEQDPVWQHPRAGPLTATQVRVPPLSPNDPPFFVQRAGLVTDVGGFAYLSRLAPLLEPRAEVRVRLSARRLDGAWAQQAVPALSGFVTDPGLADLTIQTGLLDLLASWRQQAASLRAVVAVVVSGILGAVLGLIATTAALMADRRRGEVMLLRARGGSVWAVWRLVAGESLVVGLPVAAAGWLVGGLAAGSSWAALIAPASLLPAAGLVAATLLAAPTAVGLMAVRGSRVDRGLRGPRRRLPVRLTVEVTVIGLAGLGLLVTRLRGLSLAGVDPYLSVVPVLVAAAVGLVAARVAPLPVRVLAAAAGRLRGGTWFVGLARAGRAAPVVALSLPVLVLPVALGGFATTVHTGVGAARDTAALGAVGAHIRVIGDGLSPEVVPAVSEVPGVAAVAAVDRTLRLVDVQRRLALPYEVIAVDVAAYREVAAALGVQVRLPRRVLSASAGSDPVPVLAGLGVAERSDLALETGDTTVPVEVVGDVAGLPGPFPDRGWVLAPRQALLPAVAHVDELLVGGAGADPEAVRAAVGGGPDLTVASVAEFRAEIETSGFNDGLTLAFVAAMVAAVAGGLAAVVMVLVVPAPARGRVLSLLRTMGISSRQARGVVLLEVLPTTALALTIGVAAGVGMPWVLAAALGLEAFTAGEPLPVAVDPAGAGMLAALMIGPLLAGIAANDVINRRLGLGKVLRVD